ncbi:MAG: PQQ-like beta-propeller repeat protein [Elusimicrobia bacterium]|nr:PQQ-like beta-propeller repeat protein [Elusimicrobiota bacterium]
MLWAWQNPYNGHVLSTPATVRMSNAEWRIFSGSFDYSVKSLRGTTGQAVWRFYTRGPIWSSAAVADLDQDANKEVVIGSDDGYLYSLGSSTGALRWKVNLGGEIRTSAALADLDKDGRREVLIGTPWVSSGTLMALEGATGALRWKFQTGGSLISSPAVGDIDADGSLEIIFGSGDGKVYCLNADGSLQWSADLKSPIYSSPALAQRGITQRLDVYVITYAGYLTLLRGDTGELVDYFRAAHASVSSPVVADADGDGKLEIYFQDRRGDLNANRGDMFWSVKDMGSQVMPYAKPWPMFRANSSHTGLYQDADQ